jgi:hypothetical protein
METKWHGAVIVLDYNCTATDGSWRWGCFTSGFPFKLHVKFLFLGFYGGDARLMVI